ncbi:tRNA dimethylallyltransferase [Clostridia bacterium]|nr:tRNA dimethylallyltransferase [Clostridia bacterium]
MNKKPFIVAVVGPTASGKSDAAIDLCRALNGEAVSMDAMQVYRGMRVGTARIQPWQWRGVPHHALSYVPPDEPYSVAEYTRDSLPIINDILARGKLPVLVGGTGLYLSAIRYPMQFARTEADSVLRAQLESMDSQSLHNRLLDLDPATARRLPLGDRRRMIRAIEITLTTGTPMSMLKDSVEERFTTLTLGIDVPRELLIQRIVQRTDAMLDAGLVDEVRFLLRCGLPVSAQSMQAIGYKETAQALAEGWPRERLREAIVIRTRQYAKRQMTWFRAVEGIKWFEWEGAAERMADAVFNLIDTHRTVITPESYIDSTGDRMGVRAHYRREMIKEV